MANMQDVTNIWKNIREVDLRAICDEALQDLRIALVGEENSGRQALADRLRIDPSRPAMRTFTPVLISGLEPPKEADLADLIIVMVKSTTINIERLRALAHQWTNSGRKVIVFYNQGGTPAGVEANPALVSGGMTWDALRLFVGVVDDSTYLQKEFAPAVMALLPDRWLSLGRHFPLFRVPIASQIINDTALSNAAYAVSTGLVEIVPVLDLPLNIADMIVLTKSQAFLVYRLGLTFGFSTRWQDYITEFGGVIGSGFVWRQLARYLVGLIPVWGILPKTTIAYTGTFVVGHAILRWYLTGRQLSTRQISALYRQALVQGKEVTRGLLEKVRHVKVMRLKSPIEKVPRVKPLRLKAAPVKVERVKGRNKKVMPDATASEIPTKRVGRMKIQKISFGKHKPGEVLAMPAEQPALEAGMINSIQATEALTKKPQVCLNCGKTSAPDAKFCQYCAQEFMNLE